MFNRLIALVGRENLEKIKKKKVLIIGIGGVGGYALEALVRSGINNITIIDYDKIEESNLNRQIITNQNNIGNFKVEEARKRCLSINPNLNIQALNKKLDENNLKDVLYGFDYIIDACDTVKVKFLLMKYKKDYGYELISSMGTAKKVDPTKLNITTLDKTSYDPLARKLRNMIKKSKISGKFYVVSSKEEAINTGDILGSMVFVPAVSGVYLATFVINDILKK